MIYERIPFNQLVHNFFILRVLINLSTLAVLFFIYHYKFLHFNMLTIIFFLSIPMCFYLVYFFTHIKTSHMENKFNIMVLYIDVMIVTLIFTALNISDFLNVYGIYIILVVLGSCFFLKPYRIVYCLYIVTCYTAYALFHTYKLNIATVNIIYKLILNDAMILFSGIITYYYLEFINSFRHLASLGQISAELAHEVRNPLQIIETYAEKGVSDPTIHAEIKNQVEKVARFIQELLSLGSEQKSNYRKENITHLIDYSVSLINTIPGYMDHIKLHKKILDDNLVVDVDVEQMAKVLTNIMRNGIESMKKVGDLTITVKKQGGEWAQLAISDTGIGIDESDLKKIFQPFYTTKRGTRGTGLGLAIVKKFVTANKGKISVLSQKNRGATFILKLPLANQ